MKIKAENLAVVRERERERELCSREIAFFGVQKIDKIKTRMDYQLRDGPSFLSVKIKVNQKGVKKI